MNELKLATFADVRRAESVIRRYLSLAPLIRSYPLEQALKLPPTRYVWIKDYGWTPSGSFKVLGALNWVDSNQATIGDRAVTACSSGNFASGLAFACRQYGKRAIIVMPDNAPRIKFQLTRSFGAEIRTYDIARDHETGDRERMVKQIALEENAVQASPYDDNAVIAGNGVGGLEIASSLVGQQRTLSHFLCPVSGGGLMAGHALSLADAFPNARLIAVEPAGADDFKQSIETQSRTNIVKPESICDGLLSYDVGVRNWPILRRSISSCCVVPDSKTQEAMRWIYEKHGLRTEPSGAIAIAALLSESIDLKGDGDIVVVVSGRNIDDDRFEEYIRRV
ncbi:MAG: threonine/serine dehydratase [Pirellulaceae bacterium]|nr:threonine/serine dehydratase [Pirellulaceae bacterium]